MIYVKHPQVASRDIANLTPKRAVILNNTEETFVRPIVHIMVTLKYGGALVQNSRNSSLVPDTRYANILSVDLDVYVNNLLPISESVKTFKMKHINLWQIAFFLFKKIMNETNTIKSEGNLYNIETDLNETPIQINDLWKIWNDQA